MTKYNLTWWFWLATDVALALSLLIDSEAIAAAIALALIQIPVFAWRGGGLTSFPAQVRLAYAALLVFGLWTPLAIIHWIQLVGTTAMVIFGYCFLARCLSLLPWNREGALTGQLISATFLGPIRDSVVAYDRDAAVKANSNGGM